MSLHGAVYTRLAAQVAGVSSRIYRRPMPQTVTLPAIEFYTVSNIREQSLEGSEGLATARIQVTCWADTHSAAKTIADAARVALDGWSGTADSTVVGWSRIENELDDFEPETDEHAIVLDFLVTYEE